MSIQDQNPASPLFTPAELRLRPSAQLLDGKRLLDIVLSLAAIVFFLPLLALVSLAVVLDSKGPVLFRQRRHGLNGQVFEIFKFRSMRVLENGAHVVQATRDDARITWVGGFLRRSSLDELPQLFNVLIGDMSLVGPRPHAIAHDEYYGARIPAYGKRQRVKPGITGWAQVNGARGETPNLSDMQARIALDAWYVDHASLALDLRILARTPGVVLSRKNAY